MPLANSGKAKRAARMSEVPNEESRLRNHMQRRCRRRRHRRRHRRLRRPADRRLRPDDRRRRPHEFRRPHGFRRRRRLAARLLAPGQGCPPRTAGQPRQALGDRTRQHSIRGHSLESWALHGLYLSCYR